MKIYPCNSENELVKREGYWIKKENCVNRMIAGRNRKEYLNIYYKKHEKRTKSYQKNYREKNKNDIIEYKKNYYNKNKDLISAERKIQIQCECGCLIAKQSLSQHKYSKNHIILMARIVETK